MRQVQAGPSFQVSPERQVHVLNHSITLPAAGIVNGLDAPHTCSKTDKMLTYASNHLLVPVHTCQ